MRKGVVACILSTACGAGPAPVAPPPAHACLPVGRMTLFSLDLESPERGQVPAVALHEDGRIYQLGRGAPRFWGTLSKDTVLDAHGKVVLWCDHRDLELIPSGQTVGYFDASDAYHVENDRYAIADDGTVVATRRGEAAEIGRGRFEGVDARTRRTALLLVLVGWDGWPR